MDVIACNLHLFPRDKTTIQCGLCWSKAQGYPSEATLPLQAERKSWRDFQEHG